MFCVNHYICNVVNTSFFLICVFLYTYIRTPPPCPLPTPLITAQLCALCKVMTCGESRQTEAVHQHTEGVSNFNGLLVYDNCYGISCQSLDCLKRL